MLCAELHVDHTKCLQFCVDCFVNGAEMTGSYNNTAQRVHVVHVVEQPAGSGV